MLFSIKIGSYPEEMKKKVQEVMYSSKCLNSDYMDFVGYETREKLIWTSGEGCINTNTISKLGIPKININKKYPS